MSGMSFIITMDAENVERNFEGILDRLKSQKKAFQKIANFLKNKFIDHFDRQQGHTTKWKELSPATIKTKKRGGKDAKPLVNTGDLFGSIQKGKGSIFEASEHHAKVGTTIPYAKYHQHPDYPDAPTNSLNAKKKIPKRDFIYISTKDKEQLKAIIQKYIVGGKLE